MTCTNKGFTVRKAGQDDLIRVCQLVFEGSKEVTFKGYEPNEGAIVQNVRRNYHLAPTFLVEKDGKTVGIANLTLSYFIWSYQPFVISGLVYIQPHARGYSVLKMLYNEVERFCRDEGVLYYDALRIKNNNKLRDRFFRESSFKNHGCLVVGEF